MTLLRELPSPSSNLRFFLASTTPAAPSKLCAKSSLKGISRLWHSSGSDSVEYFTLRDLWNSYEEPSAYGVGSPVMLDDDEIVQYYVPYLSAIQLYAAANPLDSLSDLRSQMDALAGECAEVRDTTDSWSDDSDRSDQSSQPSAQVSNDGADSNNDELWNYSDRLGDLHFQYFEKAAPHARIPLLDKVKELAERYPGLMTLRSVDLSPASWMAVSWYPIYHIPLGRTVKDLSTSFLTYHTLSSSFQEEEEEENFVTNFKKKQGIVNLPPFGLATYKMQGKLWVSGDNGKDGQRLVLLRSAADSWLKQLRVQHHDFSFFTGVHRS